MEKYLFLLLLAKAVLAADISGQDYIVTWKNDTIQCRFSDNPRKEGLKPGWKYLNGYFNTVAFFANDSVRVIGAGEIKGYTRQEHGKSLLCNGFFETMKIAEPERNTTADQRRTNSEWYFMNRLVQGKYASLYVYYEMHGSSACAFYYLKKAADEAHNTVTPVYTKRKLIALLADKDIAEAMKKISYRKSAKGYLDIINAYNQLKETAAIQKQE